MNQCSLMPSFEDFKSSDWVAAITEDYGQKTNHALFATTRVLNDLNLINKEYNAKEKRVLLTSLEGSPKTQESFLSKLYEICLKSLGESFYTEEFLKSCCEQIRDVCRIRFACPYVNDVVPAIGETIRPRLEGLGYAADLSGIDGLEDQDVLENGDGNGYRAYHFYIEIPAFNRSSGKAEPCLCEVQARSELQHVWAVKSHELWYKPRAPRDPIDPLVGQDLKSIGGLLHQVDGLLVNLRKRAIKGEKP